MEVFSENQKRDLVVRLLELTEAGRLNWEQEGQSPFVFRVRAGRFGYRLSSVDEDDYAPYEIAIFDTTKPTLRAPIDRIETSGFATYNMELQSLYQIIKRRAMGIDDVVGDIFDELNGI